MTASFQYRCTASFHSGRSCESLKFVDGEEILFSAVGFVLVVDRRFLEVAGSDLVDAVVGVDVEEFFDVEAVDCILEVLDVDAFARASLSADLPEAEEEFSFEEDEESYSLLFLDNCFSPMIHPPLLPNEELVIVVQSPLYLVQRVLCR